jgi:YfiH family protein
MRHYISSKLLSDIGVVNAVSLRVEQEPNCFSMKRDGAANDVGLENRTKFLVSLGIDPGILATGEQVHGDNVMFVEKPGRYSATDALITENPNLALAVTVADCVPIFVADRTSNKIAVIHAGWRGTAKQITAKTIRLMCGKLNCNPQNIFAYIGPSASVCCYEVGREVASHFPDGVVKRASNAEKFMLDLKLANYHQLLDQGLSQENIEVSEYCTVCDTTFHSYRRDGTESGRMLGVIGIKHR